MLLVSWRYTTGSLSGTRVDDSRYVLASCVLDTVAGRLTFQTIQTGRGNVAMVVIRKASPTCFEAAGGVGMQQANIELFDTGKAVEVPAEVV